MEVEYLGFRANSYTRISLISFSSKLDVNLIRNEELFQNKSIILSHFQIGDNEKQSSMR